jgi:uncharacterized SAM-binding protein YcdF (DUF218 family)
VPLLLDKVLTQLFLPVGLAVLLGAAAGLALLLGRTRVAGLALLLGGLPLALCSLPATADALRDALAAEHGPRPVEAVPGADVIVLLGGGIDAPGGDRLHPDLNAAADRIWHAARLYRAGVAPWILVSGGSVWGTRQQTEAEAMRTLLLDLGIPEAFVILEDRSRNTRENAERTARLAEEWDFARIVLVTSATHMPRAAAAFRAVGFEVVPAPTDHARFDDRPSVLRWLPDAEALHESSKVLKEYLGRTVYALRGWA